MSPIDRLLFELEHHGQDRLTFAELWLLCFVILTVVMLGVMAL